ncbi:MAG TPA: hypothetical protein VGX48_23580 [Pyrinomonadaceae bacterium]|jgi:hypothetical protein|nr:hypothetical protein [Pyrinomonadaceae bacterium]
MHHLFTRLLRLLTHRLAPLVLLLALPAAAAHAQRAVSLDGVDDGGLATLPNNAAWNAMGDFEIVFRLRGVPTKQNALSPLQPLLSHNGFALYVHSGSEWVAFNLWTNGDPGLVIPISTRTYFKVRHIRSTGETTLEGWDADGGNYKLEGGTGLLNLSRNFSGTLGVGRDWDTGGNKLKGKVDWLRWKSAAGPKGSPPRDCDFDYDLLRYEFEDDANDSSGAGLNATLSGGPAFEGTPGVTSPLVVCAGDDRTAKPGQTVAFDVSKTYSKAPPVSYSWTQLSGPTVVNPSGFGTATPSFEAPALAANVDNAEVVLQVTATDANNGSASSTVRVGVVKVDSLDRVQIADEAKRFIVGPQVMAGSSAVRSAERFERKYNMELGHWVDAFPAIPPSKTKAGTVSVAAGGTTVTGTGTNFAAQIDMGAKSNPLMSHSIAIRDPNYLTQAHVLFGGSGFASASCTVTPNPVGSAGSGATCSATLSGGKVTAVEILTPGSGYINPPKVEVRDGGVDRGAVVEVALASGGAVIGNRHFSLRVAGISTSQQQLTLAEPFPSDTAAVGVPWHTDAVDKETGKYAGSVFEEASRYDLALICYRQFYRTGLTRWLAGARKVADSRWASDFIQHGTVTQGPMHLPPFVAEFGGLIMRAADGRPEMWDYIYRDTLGYLDYGFKNLIDPTKAPGPPNPVFGPDSDARNAGWAMEWAAMVAKALPDQYPLHPQGTLVASTQNATNGATKRGQLRDDLFNVYFEDAFERLQRSDGSWRWNVPNWPGGDLVAISQPFMVGIALEGIAALHRLTPDCARRARMEAVMKKALDHLDDAYLDDVDVIPGNSSVPAGIKWRAPGYFSRGGTAADPDKYDGRMMNDGGEPSNVATSLDGGDGSVGGTRWQQAFWLYPAAYYYSLTGDPTYLTRGDEYFDSVWAGNDLVPLYWYATKDPISAKPKDFGEAYSTAGLYLAYRLQVAGNVGAGAPTGLAATASQSGSSFSVSLAWTPPSGSVTGYVVERRGAGGTTTTEITGAASGFTDTQVQAGAAYAYFVRAKFSGGATSCASNGDLATTFVFADDPLVSFAENPTGATRIKALHVTQLREAVNLARAAAGLQQATWANAVSSGVVVRRADMVELRDKLRDALTTFGISEPAYTDLSIQAQTTPLRKAHVQEIRNALK